MPVGIRRLLAAGVVSLCAVIGGLVFGGAPALAGKTHVFSKTIGEACTSLPCVSGQLKEPAGVAVNDLTGDVYVVDKGNKRVQEFTGEGVFLKEFTPPSGFVEPEAIAVDNSGGALDPSKEDVYVTDPGAGMVDKFNASGVYEGRIEEAEPGSRFTTLSGVAVDAKGTLWVYQESQEIDSFSDGLVNVFESKRSSPHLTSPGFAVDSEDNLYANRFSRHFLKLNSAGEVLVENMDEEESTGAAVDLSDNDVYIDNGTSVAEFDTAPSCTSAAPCPVSPSGAQLERFGSGELTSGAGIAVSPVSPSTETVYVADDATNTVKVFADVVLPDTTTEGTSNVVKGSATLNGTVNPEGLPVTKCEFEYGETTSYGSTAPCVAPDATEIGKGTAGVPVKADVGGLAVHTVYHYRLVAANENGETKTAEDHTFVTPAASPTIESESALTVEATAATLEAAIVPEGAETTYRFEYGTSEAYGQSTPESASIGADDTAHAATARITGLQSATTYHYRVVANNECETGKQCVSDGADQTLRTPAGPGSAGPQHCENEKLRLEQPYGAGLPDCRAYEMVSPGETDGQDATDSFLYPGGPESGVSVAAVSGEALVYSSRGSFAGAKGGGRDNEFLSRRQPDGWSTLDITPPYDASQAFTVSPYVGGIFTPELTEGVAMTNAALTSEAPPPAPYEDSLYVDNFANDSYQYMVSNYQLLGALGASSDLSHVVFGEGGELSEWVNSKVLPVAVGNDGKSLEPASTAGLHPVSSDGSRVFFTSSGRVYVRENAEQEQSKEGVGGECTEVAMACTVAVSSGEASFWGASMDGSKAFFSEGEELHEYDVESGQVTALAGTVQSVAQISEDGSYVYFLAKGVLQGAGGATLRNGLGREPVAGEENLYVSHGGTTQFIVTQGSGSSVVTPDGVYLAFTSYGSPTGYDNEQAEPGECGGRCQEVYLYDAETGSLECASCDPTGARPIGPSSPGALAEDGALFFDSSDALVPHASDGRQNVYEYEGGHAYAISDAAGGYESFFLGAGLNGDNVFFGTADQLLPEDTGNNVVVWDARVGGGFPVTVASPPCDNGDSCKPPPTPQPAVFGAPASATFSGVGNPTLAPLASAPKKSVKKTVRCPKGKRVSRGRCIERKRSKRPRAKKSTHHKGSK